MKYLYGRLSSIKHALNGIFEALKEQNFRIHLVCFSLVILAGVYLKVGKTDWVLLLICSAMVMASEVFNTAIEKMADEVNPSYSEKIRIIKDLSAAAVVISAIFAAVSGLIIFYPYLKEHIF